MKTPHEVLELDLTRHCIETAVRRRYEGVVRTYFQQPGERLRLESVIECLSQALETLDFSALRARHRALVGGTPHRVSIGWDSRRRLTITIDDETLGGLPLK